MTHQGAEDILDFLQNPKNKPLRDLIELAIHEDEGALTYVEFIQEEISKKFKSVDSGGNALDAFHLSIKLDPTDGQDALRSIDSEKVYYFNEFGVLKNEQKEDNNLSFDQYAKVGEELTLFMFHILTKLYKFKAKVVGNQKIAKKKDKKQRDFKYKTVLFSPGFEQCDSIVVLIPPHRGSITYNSLAIDEGLAYGTMLPYIEQILTWNPKSKKKRKQSKPKKPSDAAATETDKTNKKNHHHHKKAANAPPGRWGIMILDPQGLDANNNKYSIIKIYDKWLSKRIPSVGLFGGFHPGKPTHQRTGSDESISSTLSATGGARAKAEIKRLYFVGGLGNGELISHLLHRRGQSVENVIKGCIFLGSDDPYDANDVTKGIYKKCGINYLNSTLPRGQVVEGKKMNGDPYIIQRVSAGNPRFCCQSAYSSIMEFIKKSCMESNVDNE
eukprot:230549_1